MVLTLPVHYRPFGIAYFFVASVKEKGTMYQLRNLINQNSVPANEFARAIVLNYIRIEDQSQCEDGVHGYAVEFLTLALLWHGFHDVIREGDGERILRYLKFLFVLFTSSNKLNYAKFLLQHYYLLSDRQKEQLLGIST